MSHITAKAEFDKEVAELKVSIPEYLKSKPVCTMDDIYTNLKCGDQAMYQAIKELVDEEKINEVVIRNNMHTSHFLSEFDYPIPIIINGKVSVNTKTIY